MNEINSTIQLLIGLIIIGGFILLFIWIRTKFFNLDSIDLDELNAIEQSREAARKEIEKNKLSENIKELNKRFIFIFLSGFILTQCRTQELLIFPEPPARPKLNWIEKDKGGWLSEKELKQFLIYDQESENYRKKMLDFLLKLERNIGK